MVKSAKQQMDEVERLYNAVLTNLDYFGGNDANEREADDIIRRMREGRDSIDAKTKIKALMLKDTLKTSIIRMVYGDEGDARNIPMQYLKHCLLYPARGETFAKKEQRATLDGPTRAIRIKCLECQGHDTVGVRLCASVTCQLYPFRMGNNPYYGRLRDAEAESDETDEEIEALEAMRAPTPAETGNANQET